ncbi:MAG: tRNA pseudouridine(13) synthase TruD [Pseudohongiellaceae bacterium]
MDELVYLKGRPELRAVLKREFVDFRVDEELGFTLEGKGEHLWLQIRKTDLTTTDVAKRLAVACQIAPKFVGYSGMKDRRGECTQWFSVPLVPEQESRLAGAEDSSLQLLTVARNSKKLKIGTHKSNHFRIRLRDCEGDKECYEQRLKDIKLSGVPNYFGSQRFGRNMSNMAQVDQLMAQALAPNADTAILRGQMGKVKRGMMFSAARAYVFNQLLSSRIEDGTWSKYCPGDVLNLDATSRFFALKAGEEWTTQLQNRLDTFDIHITGPLAGIKESKDRYASHGEAADMEEVVFKKFALLVDGLRQFNLIAARRSLRFMPINLQWCWREPKDLELEFQLPRGAYATSLLREICLTD